MYSKSRYRLYPEVMPHQTSWTSNPLLRTLAWQAAGAGYQQTEGRGLPTSTTLNMMELIATEEHFILLKIQQCEHALWINRTTGAFSIRASWDLAR